MNDTWQAQDVRGAIEHVGQFEMRAEASEPTPKSCERWARRAEALVSRFILLRLTKSWYGREDHELTDRLLEELPGILNWAIDGWRRLHERGHFVQPESSQEAICQLEDLGSPIGAFIRDRCDVGQGVSVEVNTLFSAWQSWCVDTGRANAGTIQSFGRDLRAAYPGLRVPHPAVATPSERVLQENAFFPRAAGTATNID